MKSEFAGSLPVVRGWPSGTIVNGRPAKVPIVQVACRHRPEIAALRGVHRPEPPAGLSVREWECVEMRGAHLEVLTIEGQRPISCKFKVLLPYRHNVDIVRAMINSGGFAICTTAEVLPSGELRIENALFFEGRVEHLVEFLEKHSELRVGTPAYLHNGNGSVTIPTASEQASV